MRGFYYLHLSQTHIVLYCIMVGLISDSSLWSSSVLNATMNYTPFTLHSPAICLPASANHNLFVHFEINQQLLFLSIILSISTLTILHATDIFHHIDAVLWFCKLVSCFLLAARAGIVSNPQMNGLMVLTSYFWNIKYLESGLQKYTNWKISFTVGSLRRAVEGKCLNGSELKKSFFLLENTK